MNRYLAALAPGAFAAVLWPAKTAHPAVLAYHAVCAAGVFLERRRLRPLFAWTPSTARWAAGTTLLFVACLFAPVLFWDSRAVRGPAAAALFPWAVDAAILWGMWFYFVRPAV